MQSTCINNPTVYRTFSIGNDPVSPPHTNKYFMNCAVYWKQLDSFVLNDLHIYIAMHLNKRTMKKIAMKVYQWHSIDPSHDCIIMKLWLIRALNFCIVFLHITIWFLHFGICGGNLSAWWWGLNHFNPNCNINNPNEIKGVFVCRKSMFI